MILISPAKDLRRTIKMIWHFCLTLIMQKNSCKPITRKTTLPKSHPLQNFQYKIRFLTPHKIVPPELKKWISLLSIGREKDTLLMSLTSISSFHLKILTAVTHLNGGSVDEHNSLIFICSQQMYSLYLVYCDHFFSHKNLLTPCYIGSAVAVERIFSGERDTISLRQARLHPDTIWALMLTKHCLLLACNAVLKPRW